jgi:hypothetical protein
MSFVSDLRVWRAALTGASLTLATACERVVDISVPDGPTRLVVEGRLESVQGAPSSRQSIRLTTTSPYFGNSAPPPARDAMVTVTEDGGPTVTLRPSATDPAVYVTDSLPTAAGRRYTLRVQWEGDRYEATETMAAVPRIDSLYFRAPRTNNSASAGLRATIDLRDTPGVANFYLWDQFIDGKRIVSGDTAFRFRLVLTDQGYQGRAVRGFQPYELNRVTSGQDVIVRQLSISEAMFRYYSALNNQIDGDGSPFSVPPSDAKGNVANVTRPERRALGYFMASEVSEARRRVP